VALQPEEIVTLNILYSTPSNYFLSCFVGKGKFKIVLFPKSNTSCCIEHKKVIASQQYTKLSKRLFRQKLDTSV
jgi:hypothetical protein